MTLEEKEFIQKKLTQKKYNPSSLLEIVNEKFESQLDYDSLANYMLKIENKLFGNRSDEFNTFVNLMEEYIKKNLICFLNSTMNLIKRLKMLYSPVKE